MNGEYRTYSPYPKLINKQLQSLTFDGTSFNDTTNWLVFNDNGTEKLIAKKPLKYDISWNSLYNNGLIFGKDGVDDLINADFTDYNYRTLEDYGKGKGKPKTYKPTYVTVNGKKYIIRLMRAYSDDTPINDRTDRFMVHDKSKGSEWNRLILLLIGINGKENTIKRDADWYKSLYGRYGYNTKDYVEANMPVLADYSWWDDFNNIKGSSKGYTSKELREKEKPVLRWMQETSYDSYRNSFRVIRGGFIASRGAADLNEHNPSSEFSWLPVLEEVK